MEELFKDKVARIMKEYNKQSKQHFLLLQLVKDISNYCTTTPLTPEKKFIRDKIIHTLFEVRNVNVENIE